MLSDGVTVDPNQAGVLAVSVVLMNDSQFDFADGSAAVDMNVSAQIAGSGAGLTKLGAGTLQLSKTANIYTGPTTINAGTLVAPKLADGGSPSSIGQATNAAANLVLNGGTLQYTGGDMTSYEIVPVPEPSSTALLGTVGLLGLAGYRERRRLKGMAQRKNK